MDTEPKPLTIEEMVERIAERFRSIGDLEPWEAHVRATQALRQLINGDRLEWWGMRWDGEPLFMPRLYSPRR